MAKEAEYKFAIKDFCKYVLKNWVLLIIFLAIGGVAAVYSYKHQSTNYSSSATIMVYDNSYEYSGSISPYVQIATILGSEEAYKDAGVSIEDGDLAGLEIEEKKTGVFDLLSSNPDEKKAKKSIEIATSNAEKVIAKAYDNEKQYRVKVLSEVSEPTVVSSKKDKILSAAIIVAASLIVAIAIDFMLFNKKAA